MFVYPFIVCVCVCVCVMAGAAVRPPRPGDPVLLHAQLRPGDRRLRGGSHGGRGGGRLRVQLQPLRLWEVCVFCLFGVFDYPLSVVIVSVGVGERENRSSLSCRGELRYSL